MKEHPTKPVVVWLDYGQEGWSFRQFDTEVEALAWVQADGHAPWVITRLLSITAAPHPAKEGEER